MKTVNAAIPLASLTNPAAYKDPQWMGIHRLIESYSLDKHVFASSNSGEVYRKGWEWTQCIYGLQRLGAIQPAATALGVGAGREPIIFYLGDSIQRVTALDLYGNETWSNNAREADSGVTVDPQQFCPRPIRKKQITFVNASGTRLPFRDGAFDVCWSMSSIEHFGGHEAAAEAMREMARVTRPGGIVSVATEYLLLPEQRHIEFFTRRELERYIISASKRLDLVEPVAWDVLPSEFLIDQITVPNGVDRRRRHVVLNDGSVQWTSVLMFFRKRG